MMSFVLYVSKSRYPRGHPTDADIINSAQINNENRNLTGCLLRGKDWFAQLLEGDHGDVLHVFDLILNDQRHSDISFWCSNECSERLFPEWRMIFANADRYGADLLPKLQDRNVPIHIKRAAMADVAANHLRNLGLRLVSTGVNQPQIIRPEQRRSAP